jgi:hypothetical protein
MWAVFEITDIRANLRDVVRLQLDVLKCRPELIEEGLALALTAIDTFERPPRSRPVKYAIRAPQGADSVIQSRRFHASFARRTTSTFSCDIAYAVSRAGEGAGRAALYLGGLNAMCDI